MYISWCVFDCIVVGKEEKVGEERCEEGDCVCVVWFEEFCGFWVGVEFLVGFDVWVCGEVEVGCSCYDCCCGFFLGVYGGWMGERIKWEE